MRIADASTVIKSSAVRQEAGKALAEGQHVVIESPAALATESTPVTAYTPALRRDIDAGRAAVTGLRFDQNAARTLNLPGMAVGAGAGTIIGAALGVLSEQVRAAHPLTAIALDAAYGAIGCALGGAVGSGLFTLEGSFDEGKLGLKIAPFVPK